MRRNRKLARVRLGYGGGKQHDEGKGFIPNLKASHLQSHVERGE